MCHAPAECFRIDQRGFLDEGYWADITILNLEKEWTVQKDNIYFKCNWSPFEGEKFKGQVDTTIVSGHVAYQNGQFFEDKKGERILFNEQ